MPPTRLKEKTKRTAASSEKTPMNQQPVDDIDMDDETSSDEEDLPEKDEAELKLERMLFGDDEGFMGALKNQQERADAMQLTLHSDEESGSGEEGEESYEDNVEDMADADLFFLDSGVAPETTDLIPSPETLSDDEDDESAPAIWHDSDDERLAVSLASQAKLRKLRVAESEDIISGKEYTRRLRRQFQRMHPTPEWANPELAALRRNANSDSDASGEEMDSDEEDEQLSMQPLAKLLQNTTDLTRVEDNARSGGKRKLRQEVLDIQRLKDVGKAQPSSVDSLNFHPHYPLLLSSGPAATLFMHHISPSAPSPNPLLTSLHIKRTPIHTSAFAPPTGNKIFASGRRRYFHIWDMDTGKVDKVNGTADRKEEQKSMERFKLSPCGRYVGLVGTSRKGGGLINILDSSTAQWIAQVRVDGRGGVADFAWWSDGEGMTVASKNGEISEWDGRLRRVVARWLDAGAVGTTVLTLGGRSGRTQLGGDRWVAVGSSSGVANIYDRRDWAAAYANASQAEKDGPSQAGIPRNPTPARVLDQLTTPISHLVFAPDGQMLVMASRWKRDALRLVHLPSCTVYRNWPTSNTPLGRITSVAISPNSEQLAVGNEQGRIRLWEIRG
ncbi:uncharacterized protein N7484_008890 [Penicillium longicatenatum]|uniref:uncharacterized protein n=1 Tax=Penicillium longicatenatum TaxID=1561947 RepID=UPI00254792A6|nr:uncharacterized protein N7484_008890 [Penicillium longicatenatum]KAJ5635577.1 hypothetical protein N7484_008890 [Penicillium longicatenatum]KAJ5655756.1 hypothetical protein N7507_007706 [Penicillium longicatenatum]